MAQQKTLAILVACVILTYGMTASATESPKSSEIKEKKAEKAYTIKLGQPAPYDGVIIPTPMFRDYYRLLKIEPIQANALDQCRTHLQSVIDAKPKPQQYPVYSRSGWSDNWYIWLPLGLLFGGLAGYGVAKIAYTAMP